MSGPCASRTARCIVFSSSRTLPGHEWRISASRASAERARDGTPFAVEYLSMKRSEEHTSELQSLMRNSYAVFCLKKKKRTKAESSTTKSEYKVIKRYDS